MESINLIVEDVEHCRTSSRNTTIEDEDDTAHTMTSHCDDHITRNEPGSPVDIDKSNITTAAKPKKSESKVLKNHPTNVIIGDITGERRTRGMMTIMKWLG